jgi:MerR family transcriptional regulator, heat shock protein HspR
MPEPILTISQVAARLGISVRTIRVYEEEGFITVERYGRHCLVRPSDVEAIAMIQRLKSDLGVNLAGIGVILEMRRTIEELQERLLEMEEDG